MLFERTLEDEIKTCTMILECPCNFCHFNGKHYDDTICYNGCVQSGCHIRYRPKNKTYDWREVKKCGAKKYAKKIIKARKTNDKTLVFD